MSDKTSNWKQAPWNQLTRLQSPSCRRWFGKRPDQTRPTTSCSSDVISNNKSHTVALRMMMGRRRMMGNHCLGVEDNQPSRNIILLQIRKEIKEYISALPAPQKLRRCGGDFYNSIQRTMSSDLWMSVCRGSNKLPILLRLKFRRHALSFKRISYSSS